MTSITEAKQILGQKNVFGPDEWLSCFPGKVNLNESQLAKAMEIPWSADILAHPEIDQPHFLFLGLEEFDGKPITWSSSQRSIWSDCYDGLPTFDVHITPYCSLTEDSQKSRCEFRWYFMPIGVVQGSKELDYEKQTQLLPKEYEVPHAIDRITANVLYYLLNRDFLDRGYEARVWDLTDFSEDVLEHIMIGGRITTLGGKIIATELSFSRWRKDGPHSDIGIAASRKV